MIRHRVLNSDGVKLALSGSHPAVKLISRKKNSEKGGHSLQLLASPRAQLILHATSQPAIRGACCVCSSNSCLGLGPYPPRRPHARAHACANARLPDSGHTEVEARGCARPPAHQMRHRWGASPTMSQGTCPRQLQCGGEGMRRPTCPLLPHLLGLHRNRRCAWWRQGEEIGKKEEI